MNIATQPSPIEPSDLEGKVLLVACRSAEPYYVVMQNVSIKTLCDKLLFLGTIPSGVVDDYDNKQVMIAWDQVTEIIIFNSIDEYHRGVGERHKRRKRTWWNIWSN